MDYNKLSKEELVEAIGASARLIQQLLKEQEEATTLEYSWTGNLGHWYWDIRTNTVTFNHLKAANLGYPREELPDHVTYQFFTDKPHPEDYEKTMDVMRNHLAGIASVYEVEYRIQAKDGSYKWYYDRGRITQYDAEGNPIFLAGIVFDITERRLKQEHLEHRNAVLAEQASVDGLTQVANHRTVLESLQGKISGLSVPGRLTIALIDIDDFKVVNDTKGHVFGDKVLAQVARIMEENIRKDDLVGRYGGEEFLIVFGDTEGGVASKICERIRQAVEGHCFAGDIRITISVGVKEYTGETLSGFVKAADENLYKAKSRGKNQVV